MITKQILENLQKSLSKAVELLDERSLTEFQKFQETLPEPDTDWVNDNIEEFMNYLDEEISPMEDYYGMSGEDFKEYIHKYMEWEGLRGSYFYDLYDIFKTLFAKHPELLTKY